MRKLTYPTIFAAIGNLLLFAACDLDRIPESELSDAVYWQSAADFRQAANYLYRASSIDWFDADYPLYADRMSDNAIGLSPNNISNGSYLPSANFGPWNNNYTLIRASNKILEKAAESDLELAEIGRYVAEARFFRAYAYADLLRRYGGVPLVLQTLDTDDEALYQPRASRQEVMDAIYDDLDFSASELPDADVLRGTGEYGRISSGAALAFKSRVALREGTWNKFHGEGAYEIHLSIARDAAAEVIQSGLYGLFDTFGEDSYRLLFKAPGDGSGNPEIVWAYVYGFNENNNVNRINIAQQYSNGEMGASRSLIDDYLCTDGLPIDKSPLYQGQQNNLSEYLNRDPRLDGTIVKSGDVYFVNSVPYIPQLRALTGYHVEKFFDISNLGFLDLMSIRYAEVLLNYAEAVFELGENINDDDLNRSINQLRDRLGMPHLTNAFVNANGLNMRDEIRRERRVELAMEGFRYDDLLRWKTAEIELPKPLLGVRFFDAEYPANQASSLNLTADSLVIVEGASQRNFDPDKQYLWPLPLNQIALKPALEQNPGW